MQVNRTKSSVKGYKTLSVSVNNQKVSLLQVNRIKSTIKLYEALLSITKMTTNISQNKQRHCL